jgi:hypothetical protein
MPSNARPEDTEREETAPEGSKPPPRYSFMRLTAPRPALSDPRSPYTRALLNMVRVGDIVHLLTPTEILEAFCEAVAEPLGLATAVVIDAPDGLPRSIPWKASTADFRTLERAERRAWSNFAELLAPDMLSVLPPESTAPRSSRGIQWSVDTLAVPVLGILQCGTLRALGGADQGLLRCMTIRLSTALGRFSRGL